MYLICQSVEKISQCIVLWSKCIVMLVNVSLAQAIMLSSQIYFMVLALILSHVYEYFMVLAFQVLRAMVKPVYVE